MIDEIKSLLKQVFGYEDFREKQQEVILNVLNGNDTLAVMPTGSGKSICYQIPALLFDGITIVISPLISLMQDQVDQLTENGIKGLFLNSSLSMSEYNKNVEKIKNGSVKLLYVAPETLVKQKTIDLLESVKVKCITVDEAHCISEWGHDFRPEYRQIIKLRKLFSSAVCIALTATATEIVRKDIISNLKINRNFDEFVTSFDRKNLFIEIKDKRHGFDQVLDFIEDFKNDAGIIYCTTRKETESLAEKLSVEGYNAKPYHAGLPEKQRRHTHYAFQRDNIQIIVATIAFGMGINKSGIRFIIHYNIPQNIESYYQQIGRAGRDGINSHCLMLFSRSDIFKVKHFIEKKEDKERRTALNHLNQIVRLIESPNCRRTAILNYFGEEHLKENCGFCDNCTSERKVLIDLTIEAQKFLSCIKRTGEVFGTDHIINVLIGSKSQKVIDRQHHLLSTYNIGSDYSKDEWYHFSGQFLDACLYDVDLSYGGLKLNQKSYQVFKKEVKVLGTKPEKQTVKKISKAVEKTGPFDVELFEILKDIRKEIADQKNIPAFVIFHNSVLMDMCRILPVNKEQMMNISGIGDKKFEHYGDIFIRAITEYKKNKS